MTEDIIFITERRCCRCHKVKRIATEFPSRTNKRCIPCQAEYLIDLSNRRAAGEPPKRKKPLPIVEPKPPLHHEFKWFFNLSAVGHTACGNSPALI